MGLLYSNMKIFHYPEKLNSLSALSEEILPPLHIRLKPTNICNHNCWYCAYRHEDIQLGQNMRLKDYIPRQTMMELIEDFSYLGVKAVTFSGGGEPLCYPYIQETVEGLAQAGIKFATLTNGSRLKDGLGEIFADKGIWVRVSLDGWDGQSYKKYRGVPADEFDKVMANLENFKKLSGKCYLGTVIIVDKYNSSHVFELLKKLYDIGVDSVKVAPCLISNDMKESNDYHQSNYQMVNEQVARAVESFASSTFEIFDSYGDQLTTFDKKYNWCPYIQINPVIGADLNVYSCHDKAYNIKSGKLFSFKEQRFRDGWNANKEQFFSINPSTQCSHHCMVNEKNKMILDYLQVDEGHKEFV
jgi:MoaA/NifB/PqqE/SkfB family radical SAM enzyme